MGVRIEPTGRVTEVIIDVPEARNAVSPQIMDELDDALSLVERSSARVVVLRGGGEKAFISGGDLKALSTLRDWDAANDMASRMRTLLDRVATFPVPIICALNGDAYGGGAEVALACDFRLAADGVRLAFNQTTLAIMPAWGGIERLTSLVGRAKAVYLLTTGRMLRSEDLYTFGIVEEVVPREQFEARYREVARIISEIPNKVVSGIRSIVATVEPAHSPSTTKTATAHFADAWVSEDHWRAVERQAAARTERRREQAVDTHHLRRRCRRSVRRR